MLRNTLFLLSALLLAPFFTHAQFDNLELTEKLYHEVKQLNQFLERFNYREDIQGNPIASTDPVERQKYIAALFDLGYIERLTPPQRDSVALFLKQVTNEKSPVYLEYHHGEWFAEVEAVTQYKSKQKKMILLLNVKGNKKNGFEWVISEVKAPFLVAGKSKVKTAIMLPPNSNETNFMGLKKVFDNKQTLSQLKAQSQIGNPTLVFLEALEEGTLKWEYVESIRYHFLQADDWVVQVSKFDRDSKNSGWLISKLLPMPNYLKAGYASLITN